jgi:hypothetical protein
MFEKNNWLVPIAHGLGFDRRLWRHDCFPRAEDHALISGELYRPSRRASLVGSLGVLPYLDRYKSPRPVGEFVKNHASPAAPVYVFQSTMSDFNYYAQREKIPVIGSMVELAKLMEANAQWFLLINDKDLNDVGSRQNYDIVTEQQVGERKWYLLRTPGRVS